MVVVSPAEVSAEEAAEAGKLRKLEVILGISENAALHKIEYRNSDRGDMRVIFPLFLAYSYKKRMARI